MLRLLLLLLILANAAYFAWAHGTLAAYGFAPVSQSEPQRMTQQIKPEAMRLLPRPAKAANKDQSPPADSSLPANSTSVNAAKVAAAEAQAGTQCLQAGLFTELQTTALRTALQSALPAGSWVLESSVEPARWMVYMGKYSDPEALDKKRNELRQRSVSFEPLNNPALEPGLSLGSFLSQDDANAELARIAIRGVKTARVIQSRPEVRGQKLRLAAVDASLRAQLDSLKPRLLGKVLQPCS